MADRASGEPETGNATASSDQARVVRIQHAPPLVDIILIGIREQDAGAASGVLNTTFQLGGAIGVAALGAIFFSQLSHNAASSEHAATPELRAELPATLPPSTRTQIIAGFAVCFHDRAASSDPSVMPTSCRSLALTATRTPAMQSVCLSAALEIATGEVSGSCYPSTATRR